MVASAFLPVAIHKNQLYFLFGRETDDDSAPGFSDFGGGVKDGEDLYEAGLREAAEETTGFWGEADDVRAMVKRNGGVYRLSHDTYHIHIFRHDYDPAMVDFYNNNHAFVYQRLNHAYLKKTCIFEKIEMQWMTVAEMKRRRDEFRHFYRPILDKILDDVPNIRRFLQGTLKRGHRRKTMKQKRRG